MIWTTSTTRQIANDMLLKKRNNVYWTNHEQEAELGSDDVVLPNLELVQRTNYLPMSITETNKQLTNK